MPAERTSGLPCGAEAASNPECREEGGGGLSRSARGPSVDLSLIMSQARQNFTQCLKCNTSVLIRPANQV